MYDRYGSFLRLLHLVSGADEPIQGLDEAARLPGKVFHAGTGLDGSGRTVTTGGRVLCAVGLGDTVRLAQRQAYDLAYAIRFEGAQYREDIGHRAVARESVLLLAGGDVISAAQLQQACHR